MRLFVVLPLVPALGAARQAPMKQAFRDDARSSNQNLVAAGRAMAAAKFAFRPTPAQRTFGGIVAHAAQAND